ncbi:MAG: LPP20 family lipoprotein [Treponema sp.]|jgi:hypothetical protein|nr:LPP20 family lipoprotein [Treponema sp.]
MKKITFLFFMISTGFVYAQTKPAWTDNPSALYPDSRYVSAVGIGRDRRRAESAALGALAAYFKQSITSSITINDAEIQVNGGSASASFMSQSIEAVAALDTLIGAEIKNTWEDANGNWYAAAVMEKAKCRGLYSAELDKAIDEIGVLIDTLYGVSFETIAKCKRAQGILGQAGVHAQILAMLDGPNRQGEVSRLALPVADVLAEARTIPVDVRVTGDTGGRFRAAFAGAFTAAGFRTGNRNSRFALEAKVTMSPAPQNRFFNTRYTVDAVLKDTQTGAEIFTYNAANRESHVASQADADNRAVIGAERTIVEEFPKTLQEYLNSN